VHQSVKEALDLFHAQRDNTHIEKNGFSPQIKHILPPYRNASHYQYNAPRNSDEKSDANAPRNSVKKKTEKFFRLDGFGFSGIAYEKARPETVSSSRACLLSGCAHRRKKEPAIRVPSACSDYFSIFS
jgi:hypothetical protein